jgi:hypothetical protein
MPDTQQMSSLSLSTTLFPTHYHNGQLILKCTAHVTTLYRKTTEVHLSSRAREPIPERGTLQAEMFSLREDPAQQQIATAVISDSADTSVEDSSVARIFGDINSHECAISILHAFFDSLIYSRIYDNNLYNCDKVIIEKELLIKNMPHQIKVVNYIYLIFGITDRSDINVIK